MLSFELQTLSWRTAAPMVAATLCWGLGAVLSKSILAQIPPIALLVVQLVASVSFLWALVAIRKLAVPRRKATLLLALTGLLSPGLAYMFTLLALAYTTASVASLIWATQPILVIIVAWLVLREKVGRALLTCCVLAVVGVGVVALTDASGGSSASPIGNLFAVLSSVCVAVYVILTRRASADIDPLALATLQQSAALVLAGALAVVSNLIWPMRLAIDASIWLQAALIGVLYYGLAFWFYIGGLKQMPASLSGLFLNLTTVFSLAGAYVILGERLEPVQLTGAGVILAAMLGFFWSQQRSAGSSAS